MLENDRRAILFIEDMKVTISLNIMWWYIINVSQAAKPERIKENILLFIPHNQAVMKR